MKNSFYKLLLPMLLVTGFGAMKAEEVSMKPVAPRKTSVDIISLYILADKLAQSGFESLAISTRDTAKILGDSYLYTTVKLAALAGLLYQIIQSLKKVPNNYLLLVAYSLIINAWGSLFYALTGDFGRPYSESFKPWYDFAPNT